MGSPRLSESNPVSNNIQPTEVGVFKQSLTSEGTPSAVWYGNLVPPPYRYCKAKYTLTETGKVVVNGNRDGIKRARRKIKAFYNKIQNGEMTYEDLWTSVNGILAYFGSYNDHGRILRLRRLFYAIFGFSPEKYEDFKKRGIKGNEIHRTQKI